MVKSLPSKFRSSGSTGHSGSKVRSYSKDRSNSFSSNMTDWSFNGIYSESGTATETGGVSENVSMARGVPTEVIGASKHVSLARDVSIGRSECSDSTSTLVASPEHQLSEHEPPHNESEHNPERESFDASLLYAFSASKTSRVPGFPTFEKSGLKRKEYIDCLQSHIINMSGNEASSEESFSNDDSDSEDNLIRTYLQPVCPCDEIKFLNALKENEDVNDSESEFHSGDWYSSGYSTTDDETYVPHLGILSFTKKIMIKIENYHPKKKVKKVKNRRK